MKLRSGKICKAKSISLQKGKEAEMKEPERNWLDLPHNVMVNILKRIGSFEILVNVQWVCKTWRGICNDRSMWTVIHFSNPNFEALFTAKHEQLREMCKDAVDRSKGGLVDITILGFGNCELLQYVADRASRLKRLEITCCNDDVYDSWMEALKKFPLLEELSIYQTHIPTEAIETVGRYCPKLETLKLNLNASINRNLLELTPLNEKAIAIGENLPNLRHLELIGDPMTNIGLEVLLDRCRHLEFLDLRTCLFINLETICLQNIRCVKLPKDSLQDCPYRQFFDDYDCSVRWIATSLYLGFCYLNHDDFANMEDWNLVSARFNVDAERQC